MSFNIPLILLLLLALHQICNGCDTTSKDGYGVYPTSTKLPETSKYHSFATNSDPTNRLYSTNPSFECPDELRPFDDLTCYTASAQRFPPKCPYPNFLSQEYLPEIAKLDDQSYWVLARRNTTDGFNPFEWTEQSSKYGEPFTVKYQEPDEDILDQTCMIFKQSKYVPVRCNGTYRALCVYPHTKMNRYCQIHHQKVTGYEKCVPNSFDIENHRCYCLKNHTAQKQQNGLQITRNAFCDVFAEPQLPYQNKLLIEGFSSRSDVCWFGLYKDSNKNFRWVDSNLLLNYSFKINSSSESDNVGAIKLGENPHWVLTNAYGNIPCSICELKNAYGKNVSLFLEYNPVQDRVELQIENAHELSDRYDQHYALYCFVGPTLYRFKELIQKFEDFENQAHVRKYFNNKGNFPVYYWCEGFQHPKFTSIKSNKILVYGNKSWFEYAIHVVIRTTKKDPYLNGDIANARQHILELTGIPSTLRVMKVLNFDTKKLNIEMIMHLSVKSHGTEDEENAYKSLENLLRNKLLGNGVVLNITRFGRSDVCMPIVTNVTNKILHWPKTAIGTITQPAEACPQQHTNPLMRKCEGDFLYGGFWSDIMGNCTYDPEPRNRTQELEDLLNNQTITANELSKKLSRITEDNTNVTIAEIYLISEILIKLEAFEDEINITDVVTTTNNVMNFDPNQLKEAQEALNCTDKILNSLDNLLTDVQVSGDDNYKVAVSQKVLVQISNVRESNITGVALKKTFKGENFDDFTLVPIYKNTPFEELFEDDIELATFLPNNLLRELENHTNAKSEFKLVITLFFNDVLFNENIKENLPQANSRILSILLPNLPRTFSNQIPVIFKPLNNTCCEKICSYWKYGLDTGQQIKGQWIEDGILKTNIGSSSYVTCEFNHLTHFALLMTKSVFYSKVLNLIRATGTALSLAGILAMFIIAIIYKSWRQSCSSKILLNFSAAVALQMILLNVAKDVSGKGMWCTMAGMSLHYTLLSEFCWMLVIAILQYRRFVIVFHKQLSHLVLKSCIFCWCFPLLPVLIIVVASDGGYQENSDSFCYPVGKNFYFGLLLPILVVLSVNIFVFIKVMFAVCRKRVDAYGGGKSEKKLQIILAIFLFFLLGISWIFGLAANLGMGPLFAYLFCLTSTFQGVVLFLFFAIMGENSRKLWISIKGTFGYRNRDWKTFNNASPGHSKSATETYSSTHVY